MPIAASPELFWLSLAAALAGLLWVPYILQLIVQLGPVKAVWDPTGAHPHDAAWALRAKRAHYNAVENLVVFAPLALMVHILGVGSEATALACAIYVVARLAHYVIYTLALPVVRTVAFLIGVACQAVLALRLFGVV